MALTGRSRLVERAAKRKLDSQIDAALLKKQELQVSIAKMKAERTKRKQGK